MKKFILYIAIVSIYIFSQCYAMDFSYKVVPEYIAEYNTTIEELIVEYNGEKYSHSMNYGEKILSCKIKMINNTPFLRTRVETYIIGTAGYPFYAQIMYILVPTKNNGMYYLNLTFEEILKSWIKGKKTPNEDKIDIKIIEGKAGPILTQNNKIDKNDIQLIYYYDPEEERFLRHK